MASHDVEGEYSAVKEDLAKLRSDVASLSAALRDLTSETVHERIDSLRSSVDHLAGDAKNQGKQTLDDLASHIEDRPLASMMIALGVGILLGRLIDR